ncbi:MAG: hypothetical protein JWP05_596, partial [Microbacteriaceae bacterium]|nr:hypothetical protein [Microbacteriaceae bacterium]
ITHPQLIERHRWVPIQTPVGPIEALLPAISIDGVEPRMDPIPSLGEHSQAIRAELAEARKSATKGA